MSISAMVAVRDYSKMRGSQLLLLLMIADALNDDENSTHCSIDTLCYRARVQRRSVFRMFGDLVQNGELIIVTRSGKTNLYYIPLLEGEPGYDPQPCNDASHECCGVHTSLEITREKSPHPRGRPRREIKPGPASKRGDLRVTGDIDVTGVPSVTGDTQVTGGVTPRSREGWSVGHGGGDTQVTPSLIHPLVHPNSSTNARASAREDFTTSHNNLALAERETEPEPEPPPPIAPPPLPLPDAKEARLAWQEVRSAMARKVGLAVVSAWGTQCHLYQLGPGQWQLRLGPGIPVEMFRARFHDLLTDELCRFARAGNQVLEIVRAS